MLYSESSCGKKGQGKKERSRARMQSEIRKIRREGGKRRQTEKRRAHCRKCDRVSWVSRFAFVLFLSLGRECTLPTFYVSPFGRFPQISRTWMENDPFCLIYLNLIVDSHLFQMYIYLHLRSARKVSALKEYFSSIIGWTRLWVFRSVHEMFRMT